MKFIVTLTALILSTAAFCQIDSAETKARKTASLKAMAPHGYLTMFLGENINDATVPLQFFMEDNMRMTIGDRPADYKVTKKGMLSNIRIVFHDKISYGSPSQIIMNVIIDDADGTSLIRSCSFTGDRKRLIDFFVNYWNTTLQFPEAKNLIAERYMPGEKAVLMNNNGFLSINLQRL